MIDLQKARIAFKKYIDNFDNQNDLGFDLKVIHTMNVVQNAKFISTKMNLSEEDINLAILIAYLHDLGRFEELKTMSTFDSVKNDHALFASKILFEGGLIRDFIEDDSYDEIIRKAIENHNKLAIETGLNEKELLHAKIIRDADKIDNFRVNVESSIESRFPNKFKTIEEFNNSKISDNVYNSILNNECVDIHDRVYPLDYWLCVLAFVFDLSFKETFRIVKDNDYINVLIDRFNYTNEDVKDKMNEIRNVINNYIEKKLKGNNI